jgi:hypothetical protein
MTLLSKHIGTLQLNSNLNYNNHGNMLFSSLHTSVHVELRFILVLKYRRNIPLALPSAASIYLASVVSFIPVCTELLSLITKDKSNRTAYPSTSTNISNIVNKDKLDEILASFTLGPNTGDVTKVKSPFVAITTRFSILCWLSCHPAIRRMGLGPLPIVLDEVTLLDGIKLAQRVQNLSCAISFLYFLTLSKFTPSMEYSANLEPARNLMETVLWRFGDYSYCEFIGCVIVLGVVAVSLAYAEKERGGRSWHLLD